ncbi:DODA-type extradiol aromatic ring-opening family dioxygenase [Nonomuraea endophytica]|uniref:Aromatic ring-opening dioxygenase catalytic subunit (LigB family) n=1 Tax=Nonomuraea endophytica TaxID=714136 RepID=A0A7W8EH44_9ACTN|nr:extradiol ring-cleavage dioxygenase [Nonomuraea endophytica]MBB5078162.1 aromatic ring-opening dioxygenase catalytic subunit (LigB family) [Nonomuraea endophytica]
MAEIVGVYGTTHNPLLWRARGDDLAATRAGFERLRVRLAAARPDAVVVVATDHLTQWFYDTMPAFLVGKAPLVPATFWNEEREFGLPYRELRGDAELGRELLGGGIERGVDFAASDAFRADHSVLLPLLYLTPELEVPVVPVFTNCMAPPLPSAARFFRVGEVLREALEDSPVERRVAVIASGHLATEVGGPRHFAGSPSRAFDERAVEWVASGDVDGALGELTYKRLTEAGNVSHQFLNFLVAMGVAGGKPALSAEGAVSRFATSPFFEWAP